jgi:hypothetical protein
MRTLKNQKYFYYFFIILSFQTLTAAKFYDQLSPRAIAQNITSKRALEQDIAMITRNIEFLICHESGFLQDIVNQRENNLSISIIMKLIKESIEQKFEPFPGFIGLAHDFLFELTQESSVQLNSIFTESSDLLYEISVSETNGYQEELISNPFEVSNTVEKAMSIVEKYEKWLMETKASYELKLQGISSL